MIDPRMRLAVAVAGLLAMSPSLRSGWAAELPFLDGTVRWDNTIKYSAAWRLNGPDIRLIADPNSDDGDRNFSTGLVSNRADLLSELDLTFGDWGASASGAAWYDDVYNRRPDVDPSLPPSLYSLPERFAPGVRELHGRHAELLNAFVHGTFDIGGAPLSIRAGRYTMLWGESLFFVGNSIAIGQAPVDGIKAASVPAAQSKEIFRPVTQASVSFQPRPDVVLAGYYQFDWQKSRLPGSGSYFSAGDFLDAGGYRLYVWRDRYLSRRARLPVSNEGQFGVSARVTAGAFDYGLYALRYNAKEPQLYLHPATGGAAPAAERGLARAAAYGTTPVIIGFSNPQGPTLPPVFGTGTGQVGTYTLAYPEGIQIYGASFSGYLRDSTIAGEISTRRRMPLVSIALVALPGVTSDADKNPLYARGNTLHMQFSSASTLSPGPLWSGADFSVEVAANHRLKVTRNGAALDPSRDKFAASVRAVFEPHYYAVLPGLDLSLPVSVGYGLVGRSSVDASQNARTADAVLGIGATYRAVWQARLAVTIFAGNPARQPFTDRDFVSFSVQRTF